MELHDPGMLMIEPGQFVQGLAAEHCNLVWGHGRSGQTGFQHGIRLFATRLRQIEFFQRVVGHQAARIAKEAHAVADGIKKRCIIRDARQSRPFRKQSEIVRVVRQMNVQDPVRPEGRYDFADAVRLAGQFDMAFQRIGWIIGRTDQPDIGLVDQI